MFQEQCCNILDKQYESKTLNDVIWAKINKEIWEGKLIQIPYSDMEEDGEYLKIRWMNKKREIVLKQ